MPVDVAYSGNESTKAAPLHLFQAGPVDKINRDKTPLTIK